MYIHVQDHQGVRDEDGQLDHQQGGDWEAAHHAAKRGGDQQDRGGPGTHLNN